jgi:hypothetical protein
MFPNLRNNELFYFLLPQRLKLLVKFIKIIENINVFIDINDFVKFSELFELLEVELFELCSNFKKKLLFSLRAFLIILI